MPHNATPPVSPPPPPRVPGLGLLGGHAGAEAEDREPADGPGPLRRSHGLRSEQGEGGETTKVVSNQTKLSARFMVSLYLSLPPDRHKEAGDLLTPGQWPPTHTHAHTHMGEGQCENGQARLNMSGNLKCVCSV